MLSLEVSLENLRNAGGNEAVRSCWWVCAYLLLPWEGVTLLGVSNPLLDFTLTLLEGNQPWRGPSRQTSDPPKKRFQEKRQHFQLRQLKKLAQRICSPPSRKPALARTRCWPAGTETRTGKPPLLRSRARAWDADAPRAGRMGEKWIPKRWGTGKSAFNIIANVLKTRVDEG